MPSRSPSVNAKPAPRVPPRPPDQAEKLRQLAAPPLLTIRDVPRPILLVLQIEALLAEAHAAALELVDLDAGDALQWEKVSQNIIHTLEAAQAIDTIGMCNATHFRRALIVETLAAQQAADV